MKYTPSISIAIPAYNEEENIHQTIAYALRVASSVTARYEVLIVDDGSTDQTGAIADDWARRNGHVKTIHHTKNLGFSGAIKSCYETAKNELIFLAPADGQVDIADIKKFMKKIGTADVVVGYRTTNPEPLIRKLNSAFFHFLFRFLFAVKLREVSTATLWKKKVLDDITITANPRSALAQPEAIFKAWNRGYTIAEVGIPYYPRQSGVPKGANLTMILATLVEMLRIWWLSKSNKPYKAETVG